MISEKMVALGENRSAIRDLFDYSLIRIQEVGAENVYDFSIGNPNTDIPPAAQEALLDLVRNSSSVALHSYTPSAGSPAARAAAAEIESARAGKAIPPELFYMTCGAAAGLAICLKAILQPGERVALLAPYFPEYKVFVENADGVCVVIPPRDDSMQPDFQALAAEAEKGLKAVIVNSPNNPSGLVYGEECLRELAGVLRTASERRGEPVYLISDEPYRELVFDGAKVPYVPDFYPDTLVCYSVSKSLSMPGERLGYVFVSPEAKERQRLFSAVNGAGRSLGYVCAPSLFQQVFAACRGAVSDISIYKRNRDLLYELLTGLGFSCLKPDGAFYLFVKSPNGDSQDFSDRAKARDLLIVPSDSFGVTGYARVAYCVAESTIHRSVNAWKALAAEYFA